ncbi:MAG TPA: glycosyltransferase, partial [Candidatus Kapabacteria bacterium]|nr:glycosyltransferase [Candidatus Kapabacteria bacterium]
MQDFFHAEDQPGITPGEPANEPNMPNEVTSEPPEALSDPSDAPAARPAATASSYRDIIAERLARKSGGATGAPSPRAHSSDVERATRPIVEVENAAAASMLEGELPANIEASTKLQEIPASEATAGNSAAAGAKASLSGRERALLRQQERAALRRGERSGTMPRMPRTEPESASEPFNAELIEESVPEEAVNTESDVIAARLARKGEERQPRRPERRREESRREEPRREEVMREEPRREEARREQRAPTPAMPPTPSAGLTLRGTRTGASERPEPRRREAAPARRTEVTEPRIGTVPEEKGAGAAVALAAKLGISVVIPLYNEQDSLRELTAALKQQLMRLAGPKYEILYINDGSTDRSGEILQDILATSSRVSLINFRRNLGKSAALAAGFAEAQYGIVITMDADLQDDPREFVNLIAKLAEGYDLVSGWKKKRHDPMSKTGPSKFF